MIQFKEEVGAKLLFIEEENLANKFVGTKKTLLIYKERSD